MVATKLFSVILTVLVSSSLGTIVSDCDGEIGQPYAVIVKGCDVQPCRFSTAVPVDLDIIFDVPNDLEFFAPAVSVSFDYVEWIPFSIEMNGCDSLVGYRCPLEEGERARFHFEMDVPPIPITLGLQYALAIGTEEDAAKLNCFRVNATVIIE
ncbi:PREDICTED: uncharacterized protein LOC108558230 [Nicrophorus vespilloides]|uniref:Uncharacterized protein LOC108558230 n=1 Tax=Nicrophorus vespilloides TaxID=110193 RepID=A0ABM1M7K7_NICVS|nr:PREDICTED: uncharacterized protein LOC108558230 [Nicrophorus vespilloides]